MTNTNETTNNGKTDKLSRYGWTVKDEKGKWCDIPKTVLKAPKEYQRDVSVAKVKDFASQWSWFGCGALTVAFRDGEYWVVDGQHRLMAAMRRSDITTIPCMVFESAGLVSEARAFIDVNTNRKPVSAISKLKALSVSKDDVSSFVVSEIEALGLRISHTAMKPLDIKCISLCVRLATLNKDSFKKALALSAELSKTSGSPLSEKVLSSLYYFENNIEGGLQNARLKKRIVDVGNDELLQAAVKASHYFAKGGAKIWATGALSAINKGLRITHSFKSLESNT